MPGCRVQSTAESFAGAWNKKDLVACTNKLIPGSRCNLFVYAAGPYKCRCTYMIRDTEISLPCISLVS